MQAARMINLGLRFLLELCMLGALVWWGARTGDNPVVRILLGLGLPLVAAVLWGAFVSPKARIRLGLVGRVSVEMLLFGAAGLALAAGGQPLVGGALVLAAVVNRVLMQVWKQDER